MGKNWQDIEVLCKKYVDHTISEEEIGVMLDYFKKNGIPEAFEELLNQRLSEPLRSDLDEELQGMTNRVRSKLTTHIAPENKPVIYRWLPYVAAVLLTTMVGPSWFLFNQEQSDDHAVTFEGSITPGGNKATIVLSDGSIIKLDDHHEGIIMDGQDITYHDGTSPVLALETSSRLQPITLSTPRGGTYKVTLSDGTTVWLNAETTLKYPSRFSKEERVVELEGEAYFDVKRVSKENLGDDLQPFKVVSGNQTVAVLGTEFNVSAYADESETKTTLVEGKVRIESGRHRNNVTLLPGEQGKNGKDGLEKSKVDVSDYVDWKEGEFVFRKETAKEVLHRIARWYDIDVEYNDYSPSDEVFSGSISRYSSLDTVLDIMKEAGGLTFEIKNRTVIVRNKQKNKN